MTMHSHTTISRRLPRIALALALSGWLATPLALAGSPAPEPSVARQWNDQLLHAIRNDFARPTIHARNLFHVSAAMWDAWAAYDNAAEQVLHVESAEAVGSRAAARHEAISYASYRVLVARFTDSPGSEEILPELDALMATLGYDTAVTSTVGTGPAMLGNRIAATILAFGDGDGANEANDYENTFYEPLNDPLLPDFPGNPDITDPNRWQPLVLEFFEDQGGIILGEYPDFLNPEWGIVAPFALSDADLTTYPAPPEAPEGFVWKVFHDPGPPPLLGGVGDALFKSGIKQVIEFASTLTPDDAVMIDVSPVSRGNNTLGTNDGTGYAQNPITQQPYVAQVVPRGDYTRILAEFWADGPDSETPPGHWFTLLNYVSDHPLVTKSIGGVGAPLDDLEWDVKAYLTLGGTMHDAAVAAWGVKGYYDYVRPISAIRYMADRGQSSEPGTEPYDPAGLPLEPGLIEVVTVASTAEGERHEALAGSEGKIAIYSWLGPGAIEDPETEYGGVGWMLAENWWPYQRPSFVTPPFAGYVSGHSTYSRAAAEVLTRLTGSEYFPGGLGEFETVANDFLVFEDGPSVNVTLQWAKYYDAADECSLSRIYGGIHPTADDIPGRFMGDEIGGDGFDRAMEYMGGAPVFYDGFEGESLDAWALSTEP